MPSTVLTIIDTPTPTVLEVPIGVGVTGAVALGNAAPWDSATAYIPNEVAVDLQRLYLAVAPSTNVAPHTDPTKWRLLDVETPEDAQARIDAAAAPQKASDAWLRLYAAEPDSLIVGPITRDGNGAATAAAVVWPDGTAGLYAADTLSTAFPGAVDAYHVTYGTPAAKTATQPPVTRDPTSGAVTVRPALVVA